MTSTPTTPPTPPAATDAQSDNTAHVAASLGLVTRTSASCWLVQEPGFMAPEYTVIDSFCSCGQPGCWHKKAVALVVARGGSNELAAPRVICDGKRVGMGELVTPRQATAIRILCADLGLNAAVESVRMFGVRTEGLKKYQASLLIQKLEEKRRGTR